ncbi:MAG: VOC family protein [Acidimicrobiales bacterium]
MTASQIQLFSIPVSDQDRAREFYVNVLGFDVVRDVVDAMGPGARWLHVAPPGAQTSVALVTWFPSTPAGSIKGIVIETPDLDAAVTSIRAARYPLIADIEDQPCGRFTTFDEPDGNGMVLQASAPPSS